MPPAPWSEGDNIPWDEPGFSYRMLQEHLSQQHDAASRRFEVIDRHVAWIHHALLKVRPAKILDLGCGPGLYSSRLSKLGHTCTGIDYSPASIRYAREVASNERLDCTYIEGDLRLVDFGSDRSRYDCAMMVYGELNVFKPQDIATILWKAHAVLRTGGLLLLEVHTFEVVKNRGSAPPTWHTAQNGLFSDRPHLYLEESFWDEGNQAVTIRYLILDAATGELARYAQSLQAYTDAEYRELLRKQGFGNISFHPSLGGLDYPAYPGLFVITAQCRHIKKVNTH